MFLLLESQAAANGWPHPHPRGLLEGAREWCENGSVADFAEALQGQNKHLREVREDRCRPY